MLSFLKTFWFYVKHYRYRGRLNFAWLPDHICVKILRHLTFKECIRVARVNRRFREMSSIAVSQTKILRLAYSEFGTETTESILRILPLCANSLERVVFHQYHLTVVFAEFRYPRLVSLNMGKVRIGNGILRELLVGCPNLREFSCDTIFNTIFPVQCEKMDSVNVRHCKVGFVYTLAQRCPNLTGLVFVSDSYDVEALSEQLLDEMFANIPNLEMLTLEASQPSQCANMSCFKNLRSLSSLNLKWHGVSDASLQTISVSLRQLERLRIWDCMVGNATVTSRGIAALSALRNLCKFSFKREQHIKFGGPDLNNGIQEMARRGRLQLAYFTDEMVSAQTVIVLVQFCPELRQLHVSAIRKPPFYYLPLEDALAMVEAFRNFQQQDLAITLESPSLILGMEVKAALDRLNASANGRNITINWACSSLSG